MKRKPLKSDAISQLFSLEKRKIEQLKKKSKKQKKKRHVKSLRKMKTVISLWVDCLIFVMSQNGGSLLSEHVYNKFWWKRI